MSAGALNLVPHAGGRCHPLLLPPPPPRPNLGRASQAMLPIFPQWNTPNRNFDISMLSLSAAHLESSYRCVGSGNTSSDVQRHSFKGSPANQPPSLVAGGQHLPSCCPAESSWTQRVTRRPASDAKSPSSEERRAKQSPLKAEPSSENIRECPPMNGLDRVAMTGPAASSSTGSGGGSDRLTWLAEATARGQVPAVNPVLTSPKSTLHSSSGSLFRPPGDSLYQFSNSGGSVPTTLPLFYAQQGRTGYGGFYPPSQYSPPARGYSHQPAPTSPGLIPPQQFFRLDQTFPPPLDSLSPQLPHASRTRFLNVQQSREAQQPSSFGSALPQAKVPRSHFEAFDAKTWGEVEKMTYAGSPQKTEDGLDVKNYKMPSGREGSMKHRILRPPNITIVEPPASALGRAPLSAPPLRNSSPYQEIPSPKYMKLTTASRPCVPSYVPSALTGSSSLQQQLQQQNQHQYPAHFKKGSIIQLANNTLRRVEDLTTDDFLQSAQLSSDLRIDTSVVVRIQENPDNKSAVLGFSVGKNQVKVSVDTPLEHPFFVFNQGWSSCSPQRSLELYGLTCDKLQRGDICISLTHKSSGPVAIPLTLMPPAKKTTTTAAAAATTAPAAATTTTDTKEQLHKLLADTPIVNNSATTNTTTQPAPQRKRRCSAPAVVSLDVSPSSVRGGTTA